MHGLEKRAFIVFLFFDNRVCHRPISFLDVFEHLRYLQLDEAEREAILHTEIKAPPEYQAGSETAEPMVRR